jgi:hypothetical protein
MVQNFILAFGGTGARCAEALAYLAASRALRQPAHVLLIDPDAGNGNVVIAVNQLQRYHALHRTLDETASGNGTALPFFSTPLNLLPDRPGDPDSSRGQGTFVWEYPNRTKDFATLVEFAVQSDPHRELLTLLYDEDDLQMTFEQGYVGRAHVGSLDLFRTLARALERAKAEADTNSPPREGVPRRQSRGDDPLQVFFRELRTAAQGERRANLLVVGSVFGGTGASGLPAVPPLIRRVFPELHANLNLACVQLGPYFDFDAPNRPGDPDSSLHPLATQTALYHYASTHTGYGRVYLLGAPSRVRTNDANFRGGLDQRNASHYVEIAAALAAADFFANPPRAGAAVEVVASGSTRAAWSRFPFGGPVSLQQNLVSFATFCLMYVNHFYDDLRAERHTEARWAVDLARDTGRPLRGGEAELETLREFCFRFLEWARQIRLTTDAPLLRIPDAPTQEALAQVAEGANGRGDAYHGIYAGLSRGERVNQRAPAGWYLAALTRAVDRFCAGHYTWWRSRA